MKIEDEYTPHYDFVNLTRIGSLISYKFAGIIDEDKRKTKSTHYLAKVLNTNFTILNLISDSLNDSLNDEFKLSDSLDISSIYSLLRNQLEVCNIYWYFIDDYTDKNNFELKLLIYEYHDTLSSKSIYDTLIYSKENELYFNKKKTDQLSKILNNAYFNSLKENVKIQIFKGNKCTILTQFEIIEKRSIDIVKFKAYYKLFSTHTHSSPTAIKNLVLMKTDNNFENFEIMFLFLSLDYVSKFISNLILSVIEIWEISYVAKEDLEFLKKIKLDF